MGRLTIRLATRGSKLAMIQAGLVERALNELDVDVETIPVSTRGDRDQTTKLTRLGGRGLFVKEVEQYLLDGKADIAVHSGKDLPYELAEGLVIGGVPEAADCRDVLVCRKGCDAPSVIGTGSPRREVECRALYPDARFESIRGNVDTRLNKLREGQFDAVLLAKAGLDRLDADLSGFDVRVFDAEEFLPAPCQGILAVECRADDTEVRELLARISDPVSRKRFDAERALFSRMQADCSVPLGVHCAVQPDDSLRLSALYQNKKTTRNGMDLDKLCDEILQELGL